MMKLSQEKLLKKGITCTTDFDQPKMARVRAQEHEKHAIRSAARLGVQSEDLDEVLNIQGRNQKAPTLGKLKHTKSQGLEG